MMMEVVRNPALNAIFSLAVIERSTQRSKGRIDLPKGGTEHGNKSGATLATLRELQSEASSIQTYF
jgi:hypothetical protein